MFEYLFYVSSALNGILLTLLCWRRVRKSKFRVNGKACCSTDLVVTREARVRIIHETRVREYVELRPGDLLIQDSEAQTSIYHLYSKRGKTEYSISSEEISEDWCIGLWRLKTFSLFLQSLGVEIPNSASKHIANYSSVCRSLERNLERLSSCTAPNDDPEPPVRLRMRPIIEIESPSESGPPPVFPRTHNRLRELMAQSELNTEPSPPKETRKSAYERLVEEDPV